MRIAQVLGISHFAENHPLLVDMLRTVDRASIRIDFVLPGRKEDDFTRRVRTMGCGVHLCEPETSRLRLGWSLRRILREHGPYDVVHSHEGNLNHLVLRVAERAKVPVRLPNDPEHFVSYAGVDFWPFEQPVDRAATRGPLGIPVDSFVIGAWPALESATDGKFLVSVCEEYASMDPHAHFLWVGEGSLLWQAHERAKASAIGDRLQLVSSVRNVARLMAGAMDAFLVPAAASRHGRALLQAQAAGLPCVIDQDMPPELDVIRSRVYRLARTLEPAAWALEVNRARQEHVATNRRLAAVLMRASRFNIETAGRGLLRYYATLCAAAGRKDVLGGYEEKARAGCSASAFATGPSWAH
jgi:hypothetical protein